MQIYLIFPTSLDFGIKFDCCFHLIVFKLNSVVSDEINIGLLRCLKSSIEFQAVFRASCCPLEVFIVSFNIK